MAADTRPVGRHVVSKEQGGAPEPGSLRWLRRVTASKVGPILGLAPEGWDTPWSTWHRMKGLLPSDDGRNATGKARGHYLEDGIVDWWRDQHPTASGERQVWHPVGDWAGATSDFAGVEVLGGDAHDGQRFVLNAKTVGGLDHWWTREGDEVILYPPPYYLASLMFEMWCADARWGYIAALLPNLRFQEWRIERDDELIDGIVARCREFYDSLAGDVPPELDDASATYEAVRKLHPEIDSGLVVSLEGPVAVEFVSATEAFDAAKSRHRRVTSEVLAVMGRARVAQFCGVPIARRQASRYGVSFVPLARSLDDLGA